MKKPETPWCSEPNTHWGECQTTIFIILVLLYRIASSFHIRFFHKNVPAPAVRQNTAWLGMFRLAANSVTNNVVKAINIAVIDMLNPRLFPSTMHLHSISAFFK